MPCACARWGRSPTRCSKSAASIGAACSSGSASSAACPSIVATSRLLGVAAIVLSAAFGGCRQVQDSLLYYPIGRFGPLPTAPNGYAVEPLMIVRDNAVQLRGWLVKPSGPPVPLLVYYGGNGEEVSWQI